MVRRNPFRAGGETEPAHNALQEVFPRLFKLTLYGQLHPLLHIDILGAGLCTTVAVAATGGLGEDGVKLPLHLPRVFKIREIIVVMIRRGEDEEDNLHAVFGNGLATEFGGDLRPTGTPHQNLAGTADPLQAPHTMHHGISRMPDRLYGRHGMGEFDIVAVYVDVDIVIVIFLFHHAHPSELILNLSTSLLTYLLLLFTAISWLHSFFIHQLYFQEKQLVLAVFSFQIHVCAQSFLNPLRAGGLQG